jgi:ABC-type transporter lipoprotein component MlaA
MRKKFTSAALCLFVGIGCAAPTLRNDWSRYTGPGAEYFTKTEYQLPVADDPLEPFNRSMWSVNDAVLRHLVDPAAKAWRFAVPGQVRSRLVRAMDNLLFPVRAINNLLQGRVNEAGVESGRFVINSTVGALGLFDPAATWGLEPSRENLGRTLTRWGWRDSTFLTLPIIGPTTVRDAVAGVGDAALDPTTYFPPAGSIKGFILGSEMVEAYERFSLGTFDAYHKARFATTTGRRILNAHDASDEPDNHAAQTLRAAIHLSNDPWFPTKARARKVVIPATGRTLTYELWLQPGPAPIVYVVPGLGSHRLDPQALTVAEMAYERGLSVATVSSAFTFDFMESASTAAVPGYAPADARDLHAALDAIDRQLDTRYPGRLRRRALVGLSLGAFHALAIAAAAPDDASPRIAFDRTVAVNPPVELDYGVDRVDAFFNVPLTIPQPDREAWVARAVHKATQAVFPSSPLVGTPPVFSKAEAEFLIGLHFRFALHDAIWASRLRGNLGVLKTPLDPRRRSAASREILDFSFREYFFAFVVPYYLKRDPRITSEHQMFDRMTLTALADRFPTDGRIQVFTNANDFILAPGHLETLQTLFGSPNVHVTPEGGHLGTLIDPDVRKQIADVLQEMHEPCGSQQVR